MPSVIPEKFIRNAFIDPIKSVLVIDDEYPVLEDLIQCALEGKLHFDEFPKKKAQNAKELLDFARECRKAERGWLVDVHDGSNIGWTQEASIVKFLKERDLLILDYHLKERDATLSVEILHELSQSDNFNLCIVYSEEVPDKIFSDIVYQFIPKGKFGEERLEKKRPQLEAFMEAWEEEEEKVVRNLRGQVAETYLEIWRIGNSRFDGEAQVPAKGIKVTIDQRIKGREREAQVNSQLVFDYLLEEFANRKVTGVGRIASICQSESKVKWLRSDNVFVVIVEKTEGGALSLIERMIEALCLWNPSPARLLLNRFRAALDSKGGRASDYAINYREREAKWLSQLLSSGDEDRQVKIETAIARHWEILSDEVKASVSNWAADLIAELKKRNEGPEVWIKDLLKVDICNPLQMQRGAFAQNVFACSKPPSGFHLTTGHIIKWKEEHWVCLTPACDLVPGQKNGNRLEEPIAFKAVKLHEKTVENAHELPPGSAVFLQIEGKDLVLTLVEKSDGAGTPECREFRAHKQGRFASAERDFELIEMDWNPEKDQPIINRGTAWVVAHLRYEYALNFLQKLGINQTRIGLDLVPIPK